jgi:hypothetical protein
VWFGVGIMVIGTIIALLPERALAFAASRATSEAVTTATTASVLLLALALSPAVAFAQETGLVQRSAMERDLENEIMCTCGCRLPAGTCGMPNCHGKAEQLEKLRALVAEGKSRDEILATFVRDFGSEDILARPRDRGFGRLAWLLPYGAALAGIGFVGVIAVRWTRRSRPATSAGIRRPGPPRPRIALTMSSASSTGHVARVALRIPALALLAALRWGATWTVIVSATRIQRRSLISGRSSRRAGRGSLHYAFQGSLPATSQNAPVPAAREYSSGKRRSSFGQSELN